MAAMLSACGPTPLGTVSSKSAATEVTGINLVTNQAATSTPDADTVFISHPTATTAPTEYVPPTQRPDCNSAELVAQGVRREKDDEDEIEGEEKRNYTIILRLTNTGSCTWTTGYSVIVAINEGIVIEEKQPFALSAIPGDTVDIPISVQVPREPEEYRVVWLLEDPTGDIFGHGVERNELFTMDVLVTKYTAIVTVNGLLFPIERCVGQPKTYGYPRYGRLMHDPQWLPWSSRMLDPDWTRSYNADWYPETVPLWTKPRGGDGRLAYSKDWLKYLRALQPNDEAAVWIARVAAGLFNRTNEYIPILTLGDLGKEPIAESISSGGNVVKVLELFFSF